MHVKQCIHDANEDRHAHSALHPKCDPDDPQQCFPKRSTQFKLSHSLLLSCSGAMADQAAAFPFSELDDLSAGITCSLCDGFKTVHSYLPVWKHMLRKHSDVVPSLAAVKELNPYFYRMVRDELNATRSNDRARRTAQQHGNDDVDNVQHLDEDEQRAAASSGETALAAQGVAGLGHEQPALQTVPWFYAGPDGEPFVEAGGAMWQAMWVKVDENGTPTHPPAFIPMCDSEESVQLPPAPPLVDVPPRPAAAVPSALSTWPHPTDPQESQTSQRLDKLTELFISMKGDKGAWKKGLPKLRIKTLVAECIPPLAKGV